MSEKIQKKFLLSFLIPLHSKSILYNKYDRKLVLVIARKKKKKQEKEKSRPLEDGLLFPKQKRRRVRVLIFRHCLEVLRKLIQNKKEKVEEKTAEVVHSLLFSFSLQISLTI